MSRRKPTTRKESASDKAEVFPQEAQTDPEPLMELIEAAGPPGAAGRAVLHEPTEARAEGTTAEQTPTRRGSKPTEETRSGVEGRKTYPF